MAVPKMRLEALSLERLHRLLDPGRVYYRPVVFDIFQRGELSELQALVVGARELKEEFGDFDGLIKAAEQASRKASAT
ncbi:hypothetical protein GCM10011529_18690 [Polymorphobacter glacialis]|uniref:Uncharacterized protein n=1 Tax=Sandarakinorhabdus glacialis TaxID=1614636 RepID=A0A916ZUU5_9SPHN|nr:hypothetical protein [Polymorphobacter glacialis]GGE12577.1 hypothetical protein GCM10011529_18690 [Polymorphobacter glacialis]